MRSSNAFLSLVKKHGIARQALQKHDDRIETHVAAILDKFLYDEAAKMASTHAAPLLFSYGCDGTPLLCRSSIVKKVTAMTNVRRSGKSGQSELLCQNAFLLWYDSAAKPNVEYVVRPPLQLSDGKSCLHMFSATMVFFSSQGIGTQQHQHSALLF